MSQNVLYVVGVFLKLFVLLDTRFGHGKIYRIEYNTNAYK